MTCEASRQLLEKLVDGEATEQERASVLSHLSSCEACRAEERLLEQMSESLRASSSSKSALAVADPGEDYWKRLPDKIIERIEAKEAKPSRTDFGIYPLVTVAAALVVGVAIVFVLRSSEPLATETEAETETEAPASAAAPSRSADAGLAPEPRPEASPPGEAATPGPRRDLDLDEPSSANAPGTSGEAGEVMDSLQSLGYIASESVERPPDAELAEGEDRRALEAFADTPARSAALEKAPPAEAEAEAETEADVAVASSFEANVSGRAEAEEKARRLDDAAAGAREAPAARAAQAPAPTLLRQRAQASVAEPNPCAALRLEVSRLMEAHEGADEPERADKLHELALCTIGRYDESVARDRSSTSLAELAAGDIERFLEVEPNGERAEALRRVLERLR